MAVDIAEAGLRTLNTEVGRDRNAIQGSGTPSTMGSEEASARAGYSSEISPVPTDKTVPVLDQPVVDTLSKPGEGRANADETVISAVTLQGDAINYGTKPDSARNETTNGCGFSPELEWAAILALFSSNLFYAMEGPGRASDDGNLYEEEGVVSKTESGQEDGNAGDEKGCTQHSRCAWVANTTEIREHFAALTRIPIVDNLNRLRQTLCNSLLESIGSMNSNVGSIIKRVIENERLIGLTPRLTISPDEASAAPDARLFSVASPRRCFRSHQGHPTRGSAPAWASRCLNEKMPSGGPARATPKTMKRMTVVKH